MERNSKEVKDPGGYEIDVLSQLQKSNCGVKDRPISKVAVAFEDFHRNLSSRCNLSRLNQNLRFIREILP
jgi:hypothetical protein